WNVLMGISTVLISAAAFGPYGAWGKKLNGMPIGRYFVIGFIVLALIGQVYMHFKHKNNDAVLDSADKEPAVD
ncbi:MAG: hypothetical protein HRT88_17275, partial [Lentisphaeraceae bacterium]|nr:hypothetical protein [Lentisphaeraceae bacterium]